jgi:hypothetical protein
VSPEAYHDFELRTESFAASRTNCGIFICENAANKIGAKCAHEVNTWDTRTDPQYVSGAIIYVAAVTMPLTNLVGGRRNVREITARGP